MYLNIQIKYEKSNREGPHADGDVIFSTFTFSSIVCKRLNVPAIKYVVRVY